MNWLLKLLDYILELWLKPKPTPSPTPTPTPIPTPTPVPTPATWQDALLILHNTARTQNGLSSLRMNDKLMRAAQLHTNWMSQHKKLSHNEGLFNTPGKRITEQGYKWRSWGENIAKGQRTPQEVFDTWMDSPGHRSNILNNGYIDVGFGKTADNYWTVNFAS